jgi:2,3-bisphosphoglycerate-independent phosphoglycerate mutase
LPVDTLDGKTPLQVANIPGMHEIAKQGVVGRTDNVPRHMPAGSEVANMTLFGYDPNVYFTGRAPIEAAAQNITLGKDDWAVRCNLVTVLDQTMVDFTADHISTAEAAELLKVAQEKLATPEMEFVPGVSYRNLMIYRPKAGGVAPFSKDTQTTAPHDLTDLSILDDFPRGPGSELLTDLMDRSVELFANHPINAKRTAAGKRAATNLWLWGLGKAPQLPAFRERFGMNGAMITAVDLLRGLAALIGWDRIEVPGATGYLDTNYAGKGQYAIEALKSHDIVCVHVEATDEASHEGRVDEKIRALESIDREIVRPVHAALKSYGEYRMLVLPDHPTPVSTKKHSHGFVPFAACGTGISSNHSDGFHEVAANASNIAFANGWDLMPAFVNGKF